MVLSVVLLVVEAFSVALQEQVEVVQVMVVTLMVIPVPE